MLERLKAKRREQFVMGHRLPEARLTLWAAFWALCSSPSSPIRR
jgi:hypothetical protein